MQFISIAVICLPLMCLMQIHINIFAVKPSVGCNLLVCTRCSSDGHFLVAISTFNPVLQSGSRFTSNIDCFEKLFAFVVCHGRPLVCFYSGKYNRRCYVQSLMRLYAGTSEFSYPCCRVIHSSRDIIRLFVLVLSCMDVNVDICKSQFEFC